MPRHFKLINGMLELSMKINSKSHYIGINGNLL